MAIYKPSNSSPFLTALDLTYTQDLSCEINTSNINVVGYKIQVLDSANNIIFEGSGYTPLSDIGQAGVNGTIFTAPLIRVDNSVTNQNVIYYNSTTQSWHDYQGNNIEKFFNGYAYQPYKWRINLAQGNIFNNEGEFQIPNNKWFDMIVSTGNILGSIPNRVQSTLSTEILPDYYIQLCSDRFEENAPQEEQAEKYVGNRVIIESYDSSYGYVYPDEGVFSQEEIEEAKYMLIYKNTNDPEYVSASRVVSYATNCPMCGEGSTPFNGVQATSFKYSGSYPYYFNQTYLGLTEEQASNFSPLITYYDTEAKTTGSLEPGSTKLLIKNETTTGGTVEIEFNSPWNGVFWYVDHSWKADEEATDNTGTLTVRWERASDKDSWSEFVGATFYVEKGSSSGLNFENTSSSSGEIDSTYLRFYPEEPLVIYPDYSETENYTEYDDNGNPITVTGYEKRIFGPVYKNTKTKTYIKPYTGLADGMRLNYANKDGEYQILDLSIVNTENWSVTHAEIKEDIEGEEVSIILEPGLPYNITSYFKIGDENAFYAYTYPTVSIQGLSYVEGTNSTIATRSIQPMGVYEQEQNKSWKNYHWSLWDLNNNYTEFTDTSYTGEIIALFDGLQNKHQYILTLYIEDELNNVITVTEEFICDFGTIVDGNFPFESSLNCATQGIDLSFVQIGLIVPTPLLETGEHDLGLTYQEGSVTIEDATEDNGIIERGYGITYDTTLVELAGNYVEDSLNGPVTNEMTWNSQHQLNSLFQGIIAEGIIDFSDTEKLKLSLEIPNITIHTDTGDEIPNPYRNQIIASIQTTIDNEATWSEDVLTTQLQAVNLQIDGVSTTYWRRGITQDDYIVFALANPSTTPNETYDYLLVSTPYNISVNGVSIDNTVSIVQYRNLINAPINNSSTVLENIPLSTTLVTTESNNGIWCDHELALATQLDGSILNVENLFSPSIWQDIQEADIEIENTTTNTIDTTSIIEVDGTTVTVVDGKLQCNGFQVNNKFLSGEQILEALSIVYINGDTVEDTTNNENTESDSYIDNQSIVQNQEGYIQVNGFFTNSTSYSGTDITEATSITQDSTTTTITGEVATATNREITLLLDGETVLINIDEETLIINSEGKLEAVGFRVDNTFYSAEALFPTITFIEMKDQYNYWNDTSIIGGNYLQTNVNNTSNNYERSGDIQLKDLLLTFNIAMQNINPSERIKAPLTVSRQGFIRTNKE